VASIPLSLVERIEVLPSGSSAIYGGDALAGVVNIVLRSDLMGAEGGVGYKWADKIDEKHIWAGGGWKSEDFSFSIMASASHRGSLLGKDREITSDPDLRRFGGPNLGTAAFGVPANVSSVSGNLPGLNSSFAAVPRGSSGVGLTPADFAATAGTQNTGSFTRDAAMIPEVRSSGGLLSGNVRITPNLEAFAELLVTQYHRVAAITPPFLQLADVPASNPFNPFGTTVRVSGVVQGAESLSTFAYDETFVRPLLGMRGKLGSWQWELTALDSRDNGSQVIFGQPNTAALNAALASSNPATALNPFVDGPMASASLLSSIYSSQIVTNFNAESRIIDAFARGPLLQLPAGPMTAIFGAEHERSSFENGFQTDRTARAVFTELRVPLLASAGERGQEREVLAVQGAARYDHYSDFGSKTTWQAGLELRPVERLLLRGTYATSFKPPTLYQLASPTTSFPALVNDPRNNGQPVTVQASQGGNAGLHPTTGESSTLGFVWSPLQVRDLNVSTTRWWSRIKDAIGAPISSQFIIDNESSFPGRVIRDSAGNIVAVDGTFLNFGTMRESGIDAAIDWKFSTRFGTFTPALAGTYITEFEGSSTRGAPSVNRLSRASNDVVFAPRVKGIASIGWTPTPAWNAWLAGRYIGRYTDYTPPREIGDIWYLDASVEVGVEQALNLAKGSLAGMKLSVSGTNLTNKLPTWSTFFRGYDVFNYDLVGRAIFVRAKFQL
jgi:iron complex outermembrane receptor protein